MTAVKAPPQNESHNDPLVNRVTRHLEAGGTTSAVITTLIAFIIGGIAVLATGHSPIGTYKAIFNGAGLNWVFPWVEGQTRSDAAFALQQTLLTATTLIFVALAVSVAFRAGLFNIGGQGQYIVGSVVAVWAGSSWPHMPGAVHILLAMAFGALAGAAWAAIAGAMKAGFGAHEVIVTLMLNYVAIWLGSYLVGVGGPLQDHTQPSVPVSRTIVGASHLPVIWGSPALQGLDIGILVALGALVLYWLLVHRTGAGFELRAVGLNPECARYAGIRVPRKYVQAMAIAGLFAGLGGAIDVLGWEFQLPADTIQTTQIGFLGIAVAFLGRNRAMGILVASILFGALLTGTSDRNLDPTVFPPQLASQLTYIVQGLVVLLVTADVLIVHIWRVGTGSGVRRRIGTRPRLPRAASRRSG